MKQALDPNYYPPNYASALVDNLVTLPVKTTKEEDKGEDKEEKNSREDTKVEEDKTQAET